MEPAEGGPDLLRLSLALKVELGSLLFRRTLLRHVRLLFVVRVDKKAALLVRLVGVVNVMHTAIEHPATVREW